MPHITYQVENELSPAELRDVLIRSTLGERRPINDLERLSAMCRNANLIVTARDAGKLVGMARSLSDFAYCTYLSDLAVDESYQKQGIGKELIAETLRQAPLTKIILISAPKAVDYYPRIGMKRHEHCYILSSLEELT